MKKFTEEEMYLIRMYTPGPICILFERIVTNQNEIIDWIEKTHPKSFRINQERTSDS